MARSAREQNWSCSLGSLFRVSQNNTSRSRRHRSGLVYGTRRIVTCLIHFPDLSRFRVYSLFFSSLKSSYKRLGFQLYFNFLCEKCWQIFSSDLHLHILPDRSDCEDAEAHSEIVSSNIVPVIQLPRTWAVF